MRGHGEGTIFERADGRWCAQYKDSTGKRKTIYARRKADAQKKLRDELNRVERFLPAHNNKLTIADFLEQWLEGIKPSVRPKTYQNYSDMIRLHIAPALGKQKLTQLGISDVQKLLNDKHRSGLSPKMVRHIHACLRNALNSALRAELIYRNVATLVSAPKVETKEVQPMTEEQVRSFLESIKGDRLEALYHVTVRLGLRRGEVLGLLWSNLDLDNHTLSVTQQVQRIGKSLEVSAPKTERSRRTLPLSAELVSILRQHRTRQLEERLAAGSSWLESDYVFPSSIGTALEPRNVIRQFQTLLTAAGLPRFKFHDLRHSAASIMLSKGVAMKTVSDMLGHSQISLTANTYTHTTPESLRDAVERFEIALGK